MALALNKLKVRYNIIAACQLDHVVPFFVVAILKEGFANISRTKSFLGMTLTIELSSQIYML